MKKKEIMFEQIKREKREKLENLEDICDSCDNPEIVSQCALCYEVFCNVCMYIHTHI